MAKNSKGVQDWLSDVLGDNKKHNDAKKTAKKTPKVVKTTDLEDDWDWDTHPKSAVLKEKKSIKTTKKPSKKAKVAKKTTKACKGSWKIARYDVMRRDAKKIAKALGKLVKELKALR